MKKLDVRLRETAKAGQIPQIVVERDYVQSYVLFGISRIPELRDTLVFKGGTALKKIHLGDHRFSEDLDFSTVGSPRGDALEAALRVAMARGQEAAQVHGDTRLTIERYVEKTPHPGGQEAFTIRAQLPWHRTPLVPVLIEITHDEPVLLPSPPLPVSHGYDEPLDAAVKSYTLDEIAAEKLRSPRQTLAKLLAKGWARPRARDFFDLWHLTRLPAGRMDWARVSAILAPKCAHRDVVVTAVADVFDERVIAEVRAGWEKSLRPFVPVLPDVEQLLAETRAALESRLIF